MPKDTFYNLSAEKQKRIYAAAVQEFSTRRFSEASINQIVKNAGISRGSFYQYFADKEDIYLYMIKEIGKEKMALFNEAEAFATAEDFISAYMRLYELAMQWVKEKPEYNQIFMLMELDDSQFIRKLRELSAEGFSLLKGLLARDQKQGLIKTDIDADLLIDIIYELMMNSFRTYAQNGSEANLLRRIRGIFKIIKEGIATKA
ncbi:MAG: TetR/AcrR family transcriptional regulator [bacterium]|jgi:TetR/AcrR family transcriptional regulator